MPLAFDQHRTDLLLQYILAVAAEAEDWRDRDLGPIHFIKYAYIADLAYAPRNEGQSFTGTEWQFYHFGPWQAQVYERIEPALAAIHAERKALQSARYDSDFVRYALALERRDLDSLRERLENELPIGVTAAVKRVIHEFGADTTALLRHVYLTAPMVGAAPGERLVLWERRPSHESANPVESVAEKRLSATQRKRKVQALSALRERVREKLDKRGARQAAIPAPRYDAVFAAGTEWLDAIAGEPIESVAGDLTISPDIWKSPTRSDPDVP